MTPGFAKTRAELPRLYYPRNDRVIINAHNFVATFNPAVNGKSPIAVWCPSRGQTANDLVGTNNGTLTNGASIVSDTGAGGTHAFSMDGSNDFVPLSSLISIAGNFAISGWFKHSTISGGDVLFGETSPNYVLVVDSTTIYLNLSSFSSITHGGLSTGVWVHYLITRSGSTVTWYVNGTSRGTKTNSSTFRFSAIGGYVGGSATFHGFCDDVRVANVSFDSTDAAYLYNSGSGRGRSA